MGMVGIFPRMKLVGMAGYTTFASYESGFGYIDLFMILTTGKDEHDEKQPAGKEKFYFGHNCFFATEAFRLLHNKCRETPTTNKVKDCVFLSPEFYKL
jgi:hypothetical protein